jgi:hypothetical protein
MNKRAIAATDQEAARRRLAIGATIAGAWVALPSLVALFQSPPAKSALRQKAWLASTFGIPAAQQIVGLGDSAVGAMTTSLMVYSLVVALAVVIQPPVSARSFPEWAASLGKATVIYVVLGQGASWIIAMFGDSVAASPGPQLKTMVACSIVLIGWGVIFTRFTGWPRSRVVRALLAALGWSLLSLVNYLVGERYGFAFPERQLSALLAGTVTQQAVACACLAAQIGVCVATTLIDTSRFRRLAPVGPVNRVV